VHLLTKAKLLSSVTCIFIKPYNFAIHTIGSNTSVSKWCCNQIYWETVWCSYSWNF